MSNPVLFVKLTESQKAILSLIAEQAGMDNSAFVRDLILRYCEDMQPRPIPWPAMPEKGGDRRSTTWRGEKEVTVTMIAYRSENEIVVTGLDAEAAPFGVAQGYSATIQIDQTFVYCLGEDWAHEDIERVRALVKHEDL